MTGDRLIRAATVAAVLLVAAIAAVVSYQHLYHLAITHGETRLDAALMPLSIDGTVVTGSLLMLRSARLGIGTPWLARIMLAVAVAMTIAANVAFGWTAGVWGILMAGWPAAAFLMNAEGSISFGRRTRSARPEPAPGPPVPADVNEAVRLAHLASVAAGEPLSQRQLAERFSVSRRQVSQVLAQSNGHGPQGTITERSDMGIYLRLLPGVRVRLTRRGRRWSIGGPCALRRGRACVSTGAGPVSWYRPLRRRRRR